jgi:hypothetical protein
MVLPMMRLRQLTQQGQQSQQDFLVVRGKNAC